MSTSPGIEPHEREQEVTPWHSIDPDEVESRLETHATGLSDAQVAERLERYGPNTIEATTRESALRVFIKQFQDPLIYILLIAALATLLVDELIDTAVIAFVLLVNAVIGFTQERKAEESVLALRQLVSPKAHILRGGRERELKSEELVPGDLIIFESGTRVPADVRVVRATQLMVDESLLTGESIPVRKRIEAIDPEAGISDRTNMLFAGTTVASGRGRGYVVATGDSTELGNIAEQIREHEAVETPLQERMHRFANIIGIGALGAILAAFLIGILLGISTGEMLLVAVGLAVATVPEGLPIVFTITLAIGVHRMAQRNAIIRRLPAVETLGSTTVIGSDKTGTLTENRMTVQEIWTADGLVAVDPELSHTLHENEVSVDAADPTRPALRSALFAGVLTNEATIERSNGGYTQYGDPTEVALLTVADHFGVDPMEARERFEIIEEVPFEPDLRYSASLRTTGDSVRLSVKGAPERVLDMSTGMYQGDEIVPIDPERVEQAATEMAGRGLRVLAGAVLDLGPDEVRSDGLEEPSRLTFAGLFGLLDPPREGVQESVERCQSAGIRVIMITGDHAATAAAIAKDLGVAGEGAEVITGRDLEQLNDDELDDTIERVSVFARVSPEHKLRIVVSARRKGNVVAVTGDGVNDAPALKAADIGIAMGKSGTDVAREASDMVLADDNFVSIYAAVEQGRIAFDNVRKVTFFLISTAIAFPLTILAALLLGWPLPFLPAQLLWINLVTNGLQDVALAFEPGEPGVLKRKPRAREEGIISGLLWERSVITGLVLSVGTLTVFWWELNRSDSLILAQSVALTTMVVFQMFHVGNSRSEDRSAFSISLFSNPFLLLATISAFLVHLGALHFGPTQFVLRVEPIPLESWLYIIPVALSVIAAVELHKLLRPRRGE